MQTFTQLLLPYKKKIEKQIQASIESFGTKTPLRDACEYALLNGGKRFRPALVLMIAKALCDHADVTQAALAVEYFHTASLIADDLPCMDDDDERREKPSSHKVFGESTALLATYALISAGYACLVKNGQLIKEGRLPFSSRADEICLLAIENVSHNTGIHGATGGQYLDIDPPHVSIELIRETLYKKTVTVFEISFVLGWLFGGGDLSKLPLVKKSAYHFGMAFQIADDIGDSEQDKINERFINMANAYGNEVAIKMFHEEISQFKQTLQELKLFNEEFAALIEFLNFSVHSVSTL